MNFLVDVHHQLTVQYILDNPEPRQIPLSGPRQQTDDAAEDIDILPIADGASEADDLEDTNDRANEAEEPDSGEEAGEEGENLEDQEEQMVSTSDDLMSFQLPAKKASCQPDLELFCGAAHLPCLCEC